MAFNTTLTIQKGSNRNIDISLFDDDGDPLDLTDKIVNFYVRENSVTSTNTIFKSSDSSQGITINGLPTLGTLTINIAPTDTSSLSLKQYFYKLETYSATEGASIILDWSIFEIYESTFILPTFTNTVKVDSDFQETNAIAYLDSEGNAIEDAQVRVYYKSNFDQGFTDVPLAITTTNADGRLVNPFYLTIGFTYVIQFHKPNSHGPNKIEITL